MKKWIVLTVLTLLVIFVLSIGVDAQNLEVVGGMTFSVINVHSVFEGGDYLEVNYCSGPGYYLGGRYWLNKHWAIGLGYDYMWAYYGDYSEEDDGSYNKYETGYILQGIYGEVSYRLDKTFGLSCALASYNYAERIREAYNGEEYEIINETGNGMGVILKGEFSYPVLGGFDLKGAIGYRYTSLMETDDDMLYIYGPTLSIGLSYDF
ncbi:MAG: hypothetical protein UMV23_04775 [Halanaerobium sp.]|nr:hypothetical protein [Halanaerobium sp.]